MQPYFVTYDTKQREEFLSQNGNFSPTERDAFHKICQNWQERIPYNRFVGLLNRGEGATTADLHSLMHKLRSSGLGLLRTTVNEGQRTRDAIIVTEQFSERFTSELLDELFNDMLESIANPVPLLSAVQESYTNFSPTVLTFISSDKLLQEYTNTEQPETPLAVQSLEGDRILVTRGKLRPFITVAMLKMRYYLNNTSLLEVIAKLLDTSLISLKQQIAGKEPSAWLSVTKTVVDKKKEIDNHRTVHVDIHFFHAAWFLRRLLESQIAEAEQRKKDAENRQLDLEAVAMAIKESSEGWMGQDELSRTLEGLRSKYEDDFETLQDDFYERYVQAHGKNSLPKIVSVDGKYIHRDRVFPLFLSLFREAETDLRLTFTARMEAQLRSGNAGGDTTFVDLDNFDAAILDEIRRQTPLLAALIEKPAILAEGMIHHAKQNKLVKDVNELKQRLSIYFDPDTMKPLPLHEWFNLRLLGIFETAFEKLPILKRIWIRLTGKYESFRSRYVSKSAIRSQEKPIQSLSRADREDEELYDGPRPGQGASKRTVTQRSSGRDRTRRRESGAPSRGRPSTSTPTSKKTEKDSAQKRAYSKKQVDSAWEEFGSSIKKKD